MQAAKGESHSAELDEPCAQHLALRGSLETQVADEAAAAELRGDNSVGDDVEIAPETLAGAKAAIFEQLGDRPFDVIEIEVEHLARTLLSNGSNS